jgi:anti-sigma factor RsiW
MQNAGHPGDELQLLLDGQLPAERQAALEVHLASCRRCRRELNALRRVKAVVSEELPRHELPAGLEGRVRAATAVEPATPAPGPRAGRLWPRWRVAALAASLAAAAAIVVLVARRSGGDLVGGAARQFAEHRAGGATLQHGTSDPGALQRFFASGRLPFAPRVFDFGMMGYRLVGGSVERLAGHPAALFGYENPGGQRVLCEMYQGSLSELPQPAEQREHAGIRFRVYRADGLTLVFWQEGAVVCVLTSDGDPEQAIQLAFAKAARP